MIELTRGQEIALATGEGRPLGRITLGVGWDHDRTAGFIGTGAAEIDLDATALEYAGTQLFDIAFYNNLRTRDGAVVHHGDNRSGQGSGDDESISVDLAGVHPQIDRVVLLVSSYQGHGLEWVDRAYCRLVGDDGVEIARLTLTAGVPETGVVLATLARDGDGWRLRAVGEGVAVTRPTESLTALRPYL